MTQQCPHCMSEIHSDATTCPNCGAQRGILVAGWTADRWKARARIMFIGTGVLVAIGLFAAYVAATRSWQTSYMMGAIVFGVFFCPLILISGGMGVAMNSIIPRKPEAWFR